ncbi:MAG: hypothetical protein KDA42_08410 [Planctomycetales bacterium]|nr:hypothetical protein [Planctomycetales bacterium]
MKCQQLAQQIEAKYPDATPQEVARLCLLLSTQNDDLTALADPAQLDEAWKKTSLRLQHATDQHAAMTDELEQLASSDPRAFSQDQIWVLVRAIKVQSQVLEMYVGEAALDV